jgi:hypothetical protein
MTDFYLQLFEQRSIVRDILLEELKSARAITLDAIGEQIQRRRWRVLHAAFPYRQGLSQAPSWVETPEEFLGWAGAVLKPEALRTYMKDLELIAKQTCDLVLLRLARENLARRSTRKSSSRSIKRADEANCPEQ